VSLGYVSNSILAVVDCSDLQGRLREDLFMNSRDRLRGGEFENAIERQLEDLLRSLHSRQFITRGIPHPVWRRYSSAF